MSDAFQKRRLSGKDYFLQRFFEILPGAVSWSMLIGIAVLSFTRPALAVVLIIAFDFYWLLRLFYLTFFLVIAYVRLSFDAQTDWMARVAEVDAAVRGEARGAALSETGFRRRQSFRMHAGRLKELKKTGSAPPPSGRIRHLVIIPISKESREIVEPGLAALAAQSYPKDRITVFFALEERAGPEIREAVEGLVRDYRKIFRDLRCVVHPDGLEGESRVKGANVTFAAKAAAEYFAAQKIPFEDLIASCFDADTVVSPHYMACLTYHYLVSPQRTRASFQPIPVYHNNLWKVPPFARVLEMGSSFFQLVEATNPEKLVTFSSHSMSFKALVEVGYWPVDMISDDSAIFWKALLHYEGDYRVVPMNMTVSMDVVAADTWWQTAKNLYKQKRRWAWGVENFPLMMRGFIRSRRIPLRTKLQHAVKLFELHLAWATWGFILSFLSWLPVLLARGEFSSTVLYYSAPRVTAVIWNLAGLGFATTTVISLALLPKDTSPHALRRKLLFTLEWLATPLVLPFLTAMPALDAQTRLMFGRYMEFWVTDKKR